MVDARPALFFLVLTAGACSDRSSGTRPTSGADRGEAAAATPAPPDLPTLEGIDLPPGTSEVHREDEVGDHGDSLHTRWLASTKTPAELSRFFATATETREPGAREFRFDNGWVVTVAPPDPIPTTHVTPVRPVVRALPDDLAAWIIFSRTVAPPPCPECPPGQVRRSQSTCRCGPPP